MMRFAWGENRFSSVLALCGLVVSSSVFASAQTPECIEFKKLPQVFASELSLDLKTTQIRFLPFEFPSTGPTSGTSSATGARKGFVLQNLESCGLRGNCDSLVFLSDSTSSRERGNPGCYRAVLEFTGRWNGVVQARSEKRAPASVRVDHRAFEWNEKSFRFEERTK